MYKRQWRRKAHYYKHSRVLEPLEEFDSFDEFKAAVDSNPYLSSEYKEVGLLNWAILRKKYSIVKGLLDSGVNVEESKDSPFVFALGGPIGRGASSEETANHPVDLKMVNLLLSYEPVVETMHKLPCDTRCLFWEHEGVNMLMRNRMMEKTFSKVIAGGIQSTGEFRGFLAEGVCDARLLIHIASFAYN